MKYWLVKNTIPTMNDDNPKVFPVKMNDNPKEVNKNISQ
jgi:hypothetical protein